MSPMVKMLLGASTSEQLLIKVSQRSLPVRGQLSLGTMNHVGFTTVLENNAANIMIIIL